MDPYDCYRIEGSGSQAGYSGVKEDYPSPRYTFDLLFVGETTPPTVLTTMLEHIPWRVVRTFVVSDLSYESASQWIAAFRPLKQVTTLKAWSDTGTLALAQALCSLVPQVGRPTPASRKTSMELFPLLHSISLKSMCFAEWETYDVGLVGELTEPLLDCLARRRDRGVEIRKLQITNCYNIDDRDIERLCEIVPSAEWDGKVMVDEPE
ncbi:hypothetical protein WOLCODRAFT_157075 [Wolfiporia cocos MD-104 SS10]|uniref:F-box domain-containing protein n=1 Tax=Wolfiporia cocos (strain MD-104) TaxID=742152 RepID=A0A2H3J3W2_WOLCO|nr:hypothetical protein WOLCODRAFT_157075 [Wolfiporia cocos MD-104 SS10]